MTERKRILVITAHPDDADVHAGGTLARWADEGHEIHSAILTRGDKGHADPSMTSERVAALREREQRAAAAILGVSRLTFFDHGDGDLAWAGPRLTEDLTKLIRVERPDIVVTHDPFAGAPGYRQFQLHPDHRAVGAAAVDALVNRAPGPLFYPAHAAQGIAPHRVSELLLIMGDHLDHFVDIAPTFERKVRAVLAHASQFGDHRDFPTFLRGWAGRVGGSCGLGLAEGFKRLTFHPP
jgi:LmbE family N-acetylglucosaminyl deacetylase